ncbi:VWA domain-containing protein [Haloferula chungangensis]|uniref:VWA domain-containing protein n=1 Tax=Haloferula chungangensis TaxID=1048331 RepID=A0ABW2L6W2_9BACT
MNYVAIQWPWMLLLLLAIVPLAGLLARARKKRAALRRKLGLEPTKGEFGRDALRVIAMVLLVLAMSRPGYAPERRSVSQSGRDVVFAIDVSRSMLAEDAHPSRLEAAKQGVRDALEGFGTERAGLVIYAGSATILCPLTYDYDFVRYMLEQVSPRAVDFGGTTVLSAVEKSVDNVFSDERSGMQDLVVLSDGEDHVPDTKRVAELLESRGVDLLLVGLGDPTSSSRIPIENEEGGKSYLKQDGDFVSTRLNEEVLRGLAEDCRGASFVAPGTAAFDLGDLYANFAMDKPAEGAVGADSFVVYREAGFGLIAVALVLLLLGGRMGRAGIGVMLMSLAFLQPMRAESVVFDEARALQVEGKFDEALEAYGEVEGQTSFQTAAIRFNQALCYLNRAEGLAGESPGGALEAARQAQRCFLEAARLDPGLERAGRRLDSTAVRISAYAAALKEKEQEEQALQEKLDKIIEHLKELHEKQSELRTKVAERLPKRGSNSSPPASGEGEEFGREQGSLKSEAQSIEGEMTALDQEMLAGMPEGTPPEMSMMRVPLRLMTELLGAQDKAREALAEWSRWAESAAQQQVAILKIEEILAILEGGDSGESEEGEDDEGEWDEEGDWEDYEDSEDGMPSSMPMEGDLAAGSEMAPLPVPNYSAEELLMEEQGNMQFREQQRAKGQAGKVEKDW